MRYRLDIHMPAKAGGLGSPRAGEMRVVTDACYPAMVEITILDGRGSPAVVAVSASDLMRAAAAVTAWQGWSK